MQFQFTKKVDSHRINERYKCLLLDLSRLPEFHYKAIVRDERGRILRNVTVQLVKADLMPTYDWMMEANRLMCAWKPEFAVKLYNAVMIGDLCDEVRHLL